MADYFIDALRNEESMGANRRGFANAKDGDDATLSYSFLTERLGLDPERLSRRAR